MLVLQSWESLCDLNVQERSEGEVKEKVKSYRKTNDSK